MRYLLVCLLSFVLCSAENAFSAEDRWEKAIAAFEAKDAEALPAPGGVVFIGSSSIRMWDTAEAFPEYNVTNRGFGGSEVSDSLRYADRILIPYKPRLVFLYAGDNDIAGGKDAERVFKDYKAFVTKVRAALPEVEIQFVAIKPSLARWELVGEMRKANALIREFCEKETRLGFVDIDTPMIGANGKPRAELFMDDGLHLNKAGYDLWNSLVEPIMKRALGD